MGNMMIKKVIYSGDRYSFESPEMDYGVNIVVGDNGSGKSTFSYFIEYVLGGNIKPFVKGKEITFLDSACSKSASRVQPKETPTVMF